MDTISVVGASGLVGRRIVGLLAGRAFVKAWVRRPSELPEGVVPTVSEALPPADDGFWQSGALFVSLGTTIRKAGSRERFEAVDHDLVLECARRARGGGCRTLALVSAAGADPASRIFYSQVKGRVEAAVRDLCFQRVVMARPSLLLGDREEFRAAEWLSRIVAGPVRGLFPASIRPVRDIEVARGLVDAVFDPSWNGTRILTNADLVGGSPRGGKPPSV